jgi:hypothetical protein
MNDVLLLVGCENDPTTQLDNPLNTKVGGKKVYKLNDLLGKWVIPTCFKHDFVSVTQHPR